MLSPAPKRKLRAFLLTLHLEMLSPTIDIGQEKQSILSWNASASGNNACSQSKQLCVKDVNFLQRNMVYTCQISLTKKNLKSVRGSFRKLKSWFLRQNIGNKITEEKIEKKKCDFKSYLDWFGIWNDFNSFFPSFWAFISCDSQKMAFSFMFYANKHLTLGFVLDLLMKIYLI